MKCKSFSSSKLLRGVIQRRASACIDRNSEFKKGGQEGGLNERGRCTY